MAKPLSDEPMLSGMPALVECTAQYVWKQLKEKIPEQVQDMDHAENFAFIMGLVSMVIYDCPPVTEDGRIPEFAIRLQTKNDEGQWEAMEQPRVYRASDYFELFRTQSDFIYSLRTQIDRWCPVYIPLLQSLRISPSYTQAERNLGWYEVLLEGPGYKSFNTFKDLIRIAVIGESEAQIQAVAQSEWFIKEPLFRSLQDRRDVIKLLLVRGWHGQVLRASLARDRSPQLRKLIEHEFQKAPAEAKRRVVVEQEADGVAQRELDPGSLLAKYECLDMEKRKELVGTLNSGVYLAEALRDQNIIDGERAENVDIWIESRRQLRRREKKRIQSQEELGFRLISLEATVRDPAWKLDLLRENIPKY